MKYRMDAIDLRILGALAEGPRKFGHLVQALGMNRWTLLQRLGKLQRYGFVQHRSHGPYALSPEGREELERRLGYPLESPNRLIASLVEVLPSDLHRAIFRLGLDIVVAKHHLLGVYREGWPAILVCGPTKSLKTSVGRLLAWTVGLDPLEVEHLCYPGRVTPGNPGIRRLQREGGVWEVRASPDFGRPLVILDELDKAVGDSSLRRSLFAFLDDRAAIVVEGQRIEIRCTAYVTANWGREKLLSDRFFSPYLRRGFVADTTPIASGWGPGVAEEYGQRIASLRVPKLDLSRLKPPEKLPEGLRRELVDLFLPEVLPEGRELVDLLPLILAVLGRASLVGDLREAVFEVVFDRLTLVESLGLARPGWRERVGRRWVEYRAEREPEVRRRLEEAERRREEVKKVEAALARRASERKRERLELAREREEFLLALSSLRDELARHRLKPGLQAALGEAIELAKGACTLKELEGVKEAAASFIENACWLLKEFRELLDRREALEELISSIRQMERWSFFASRVDIARELERVGILKPKEVPFRLPPPPTRSRPSSLWEPWLSMRTKP